MTERRTNMQKSALQIAAITCLAFGLALVWSAMTGYNHDNDGYAIYAVGAANYFGAAAIVFALFSATYKRRK